MTRLLGGAAIATWLLLGTAAPVVSQQARDAGNAPMSGTAAVTGTVLSDEARPEPVRRVIVTVTGPAVPEGRSAITDDAGRFTLRNLPAGRLTITAAKRGYVPGAFGARRPGGLGTPVELGDGQSVNVQIAMARGAVITGVVRSTGGDPVPDMLVFAIEKAKQLEDFGNSLMASQSGGRPPAVITDDRGVYRIYGLLPGDYLVAAVAMNSQSDDLLHPSVAEIDQILGHLQRSIASTPSRGQPRAPQKATLSPVFYPGTTAIADGIVLRLAAGEERQAVDLTMAPVPVASMDGVIASDGGSLAAIELTISPPNALNLFALASALPVLAVPPGADGKFRYTNLIPGRYTLFARANRTSRAPEGGRGGVPVLGRGATGNARETFYAMETVTIDGNDLSGVTLQLRRGGAVSGRIQLDRATDANIDVSQLRVSLLPIATTSYSTNGTTVIGNNFGISPPGAVGADGRFELAGVAPGTYRIGVPGALGSWWLRSAVARDRDLLDTLLDVELTSELSNVVLTLTNRHSEISGRLLNPGNLPAPEYTVVIVPGDRSLRTRTSRRVLSTRPTTAGTFSFTDLPGGDYVLAVITDLDPAWRESNFLEQVASAGVKVSIADGERKTQDLRVR